MKLVGTRLGDHVDLCATGRSAFGRVIGGADAELGDRIERNVESGVGPLGLLLHAAGVDAVEGEVAVIQRMAGETDLALAAVCVVDGSLATTASGWPNRGRSRGSL